MYNAVMEREPNTPPTIRTPEEYTAAIEELAVQRSVISFFNRFRELREVEPATAFRDLVEELADKPKIITREQAGAFTQELVINRDLDLRTSIDCGEPVALESYLLSKVLVEDNTAFEFDSVKLSSADAFSVFQSIRMLRDTVRTKRFIQGVTAAVAELDSPNKEEIYVCDAGSGALPVLALAAVYSSPKVKAVCIETNELSIEIARTLVQSLGIDERFEFICADAREYIPDQKIDLLISETMDVGLLNEPMCEIVESLSKYLAEGAQVVPAEVRVFATAMSVDDYSNIDTFVHIDELVMPAVEAEWSAIGRYAAGQGIPAFHSRIKNTDPSKPFQVFVSAEVSTHPNVDTIAFNQSRLTCALPVNVKPCDPGSVVELTYRPGDELSKVRLGSKL